MLLAGVAGSIRGSVLPGSVWWANEVRSVLDPHEKAHPTFVAPTIAGGVDTGHNDGSAGRSSPDHTGIVQAKGLVTADRDRLHLAERFSSCSLVDMESWAFSLLASECRCPWGIVRGVTDTIGSVMPMGMERWMNSHGQLRPVRFTIDILRRQHLVPTLRTLSYVSNAVLSAVAEEIVRAINAFARTTDRSSG
ncbi:MAG: hypothetical protein ACOC0P_01055 [Planctomycetota bacterium]